MKSVHNSTPSPRKLLSGCPELENAVRIAIRIDLRDFGWRQDAVRTYSPEGPLPMKLLVCPLAPQVQHPGGVAVQQAQISPEVFACDSHAFTRVLVAGEGALAQLR